MRASSPASPCEVTFAPTVVSAANGPPDPDVERSISNVVSLWALSTQERSICACETADAARSVGAAGGSGTMTMSNGAPPAQLQSEPMIVPFTVVPADPETAVPVPSFRLHRPMSPVCGVEIASLIVARISVRVLV